MADKVERDRDQEEIGQTSDADAVNSADDEEFDDLDDDESEEDEEDEDLEA